MKTLRNEEIRQVVRDTYGGIAKGESAGCGCGCVSENHSGPEDTSLNVGYSGEMCPPVNIDNSFINKILC